MTRTRSHQITSSLSENDNELQANYLQNPPDAAPNSTPNFLPTRPSEAQLRPAPDPTAVDLILAAIAIMSEADREKIIAALVPADYSDPKVNLRIL